jgi:hypothetical protein
VSKRRSTKGDSVLVLGMVNGPTITARVVELSNGQYEVHNIGIGVNWPHHIFASHDFKVVGAFWPPRLSLAGLAKVHPQAIARNTRSALDTRP